jgi:alpha/beta superfamily hydrolase
VQALVESLPGEKHFVMVPSAADHFFVGKLDQLDRAIQDWYRQHHLDH